MTFEFFMIIIAVLVVFCGIMIFLWFRAEKRADKLEEMGVDSKCQDFLMVTHNMIDILVDKYNISEDEINQVFAEAKQKYKKEIEDLGKQIK